MKTRILCLFMSAALLLSAFLITGYSSEINDINYFFVIFKHEYSEDLEKITEFFNHDAVKRIEIISEPFDTENEDSKAAVVVYINLDDAKNIGRLYSYIVSDERVQSVSPDYEMVLKNAEEENKLQEKSYLMPYDVNGDGAVTASDAREVLRASVGLSELNLPAKRAVGAGENEPISAFSARKILRASVGLEKAPEFTVDIENYGEEFVIGPLDCHGAAGFSWELGGETDKFTVTEKSYGADTLDIGGPVRYYYIFIPKEKGAFKLKFTYKDIKVPETVNEFTLDVHHQEKVCVLPGPDDEIRKNNSVS